jgi:hypothetical protein
MSIPYLVFARSLIPQHRVNCYHFWTPIQAIIRSASPLMMKKKHHSSYFFRIFCYTKMTFKLKNGEGNLSEVHSHHLGASDW